MGTDLVSMDQPSSGIGQARVNQGMSMDSEQLQPATSSASPPSPGQASPLEKFSDSGTVSPLIWAWDWRALGPVIHVFVALSPAACLADSTAPNADDAGTATVAICAVREFSAMSNTLPTASAGSSASSAASICALVVALMLAARDLLTAARNARVWSTLYSSGAT